MSFKTPCADCKEHAARLYDLLHKWDVTPDEERKQTVQAIARSLFNRTKETPRG
jgi:hypothetical protein